jgi:hypothetical protein
MQDHRTPPAEGAIRTALSKGFAQALRLGLPPILGIALLWLTGDGRATPVQAFLALFLLQMAWGSWVWWKEKPGREKDFPLFAAVAAFYFLAFGFPAFWSSHWGWQNASSDEGIKRGMLLAVVGAAALWCGMRLDLCRRLRRASTLEFRDTPVSPRYIALVMFAGIPMRAWPSLFYVFGSGFRQVFVVLANTVPLAAYAILLRRQLLRPVPLYERLLLVLFVALTFFGGLATGWLGTGAVVLAVTGYVLIDVRHRIPKVAVALALLYVFFLQPAKEQFRLAYWGRETSSGAVERAADWISTSRTVWSNTLASATPGAWRDLIYSSMGRGTLLPQTASVMDVTPGIVPYQGSRMYGYLAVTLIPRAIWPQKPSVNEANRFYQVTYGITAEKDLDGVSISVGMLTEAYISYGWPGAVAVMFAAGIFLNLVNIVMLGWDSGVLMKAIGIALLPTLASVDAQMAQWLGGFLQQVLLTIAVMLPIVQVRRRSAAKHTAPGRRRVTAPGPFAGQGISLPPATQ